MKLEIDDKKIEDILRLEIAYKLSGSENRQKIDDKIESIFNSKIDEYLKSVRFEEIIKEIASKAILDNKLGGVLEKFNEDDFNNRFEHIMSRSILKSKLFNQMLSDKMKSFIRIGG